MIQYYDLYTGLFGKYPYSNFTLAENFFATGFGMPGYTLISGRLLKMPWIVLSPGSLAHEFVHNWWGNSVYLKNDRGNWCEALTTFSANYYYNELTGNMAKALDWRKKALIAIENLPAENSYPLKDFKYQKNTDDAVIGYSKGAFMFYELFKVMGKEHFFGALKEFAEKYTGKRATWFSLQFRFRMYAKAHKLDLPLDQIFDQWLKKIDVPRIKIANAKVSGNKYSFDVVRDKDFFLTVPVKYSYKNPSGDEIETIDMVQLTDSIVHVEKILDAAEAQKTMIELDPNYQVLRSLYKWEIPYTLGRSLKDKPFAVLPSKKSAAYKVCEKFMGSLKESGYEVGFKSIDDLKAEDWQDRSVLVMGNDANNDFYLMILKNWHNSPNSQY
jgi:aminopeptidase N